MVLLSIQVYNVPNVPKVSGMLFDVINLIIDAKWPLDIGCVGYDNDGLVTDESIKFLVKNSLAGWRDPMITNLASIKEPQLAF